MILIIVWFLEFKTPLEPFEWDLIQEEGNTEYINNNDTTDGDLSP